MTKLFLVQRCQELKFTEWQDLTKEILSRDGAIRPYFLGLDRNLLALSPTQAARS
jgi:hypothetical protein